MYKNNFIKVDLMKNNFVKCFQIFDNEYFDDGI